MIKGPLHIVRAAVLAVICAGCTGEAALQLGPPAGGSAARDVGSGVGEVERFLAQAAPGASAVLTPAGEGAPVVVVIEREYHAASGRLCRRLSLERGARGTEERTACRDGVGIWRMLPQLTNRDLSSVAASMPASRPLQ